MTVSRTSRFEVRPDGIDAALDAIRTFIRQVGEHEPDTLSYESWQEVEEPTRFLHLMTFRDEGAEEHHRGTEHVKRFTDALYPLTVDPPAFTGYREAATTRR